MVKGRIGLLTLLIMCFLNIDTCAQGRDCCFRYAIYNNCTVDDIMHDNKYGDLYCDSIKNWLAELMSRDCFHFKRPEVIDTLSEQKNAAGRIYRVKPTFIPEHEYSFDMNFISASKEFTEAGCSTPSSLTVSMYFEGEQREFVHRWKTQGIRDTISNSATSWMWHDNELKRTYKEGLDIYEIIKRFEKKPTSCQIQLEKEDVNLNEIIEIELSDFRDGFGQSSREFNRIIVHAQSGEIINGSESYIGPDYKVFRVDDGTIIVKYRAPDENKENIERITVYSSCDILPITRVLMSSSEIYERVKEKTIGINDSWGKVKNRTKFQLQMYEANL